MGAKRHRSIWIATAVAILALTGGALASAASAAKWCVHKAATAECPPGSDLSDGDNLNAAMQHTDNTAAPDVVFIAPGVYDAADHGTSFNITTANPLTIVGAGRTRTTLTNSSTGAPFVLDLAGPDVPIDVSRLKIRMQAQSAGGLRLQGGTAHLIDVTADPQMTIGQAFGVQLTGAATLRSATIATAGASVNAGIDVFQGINNLVEDVAVAGPDVGVKVRAAATTTNVHRTILRAAQPVKVEGTSLGIDDSLLIAHALVTSTAFQVTDTASSNASVGAKHLTIVIEGDPTDSFGFFVAAFNGNDADVDVTNSIIRGFA